MDEKDIDYGNLPSNALVNLGKDAIKNSSQDGYVDYGSLPSKTLPELGKQVLKNRTNN